MLASRLGAQDVVLAGEREAVKLPDFDLGNSPYEFTKEAVCDRSVIISTTNGTAAIHGMSAAKEVLIGGMIMIMLGLIGEYIGRMYICMNNAPQFVIRDLIPAKEENP